MMLTVNNSTIYGQKNYWGGGNPKQSSYNNSYIYIDPILTEDPWEWNTPPLPLVSIENNSAQEDLMQLSYQSINKGSQFDELSAIFTVLELENEKQVDQAIEFYKTLIANDRLVIFSLNKLMKIQSEYTGKDITSYFKELIKSKKYGLLVNKLLGNSYLQSGQFADAITIYNSIIENYPDDYQSISARFEKLFAYLNIKKDKAEANKILTEIKIMNLKEEEWAMLIDASDYLINESVNKLILPKQYTNAENKILTKYNLSQNYPNPFNPTTLLNYSVKEAGLVKIKVYDVLGCEVAELVKEIKEAGYHSVEFNASQLVSGVYIYTLQVNGYSASRKMLLLK
jgi:tetratricopeptide (TPR) repeat protein